MTVHAPKEWGKSSIPECVTEMQHLANEITSLRTERTAMVKAIQHAIAYFEDPENVDEGDALNSCENAMKGVKPCMEI